MLKSQKLEIRSVEIRGRLAELAALDSLEDGQATELREKTGELRDVEAQRVATLELEAIEAESRGADAGEGETLDTEERERREILGKAKIGNALRAMLDGKSFTGAESELRSACGLLGDHEIPNALFEPRAATPAPGGTAINEQPVQPYIYKEGVAGYLGIDMPSIASGSAAFPVLTTKTPAGPKAKGGAADETAAAFSVSASSPKRVTGSFRVRVEDIAVFGQLEDALRRDIPMALADAVADQLLNGNGASPNINGLLKRLTDPDAEAVKNTPASYVSTIVGALDGRHGYDLKALRALVGKSTFVAMAASYFDNTSVSTAAYLDANTGGVRMSDRVPAVAANVQAGIVRVGMTPWSAVSAVWGGVQLIRDNFTGAGKGEIVVTALQLISDVHVLRSGSFAQVSFKP